jgi:hypothetical protein
VVQANDQMFRPGIHDAPGEVIHSADSSQDIDPAELWMIARRLYALKGTVPSEADLIPFADRLTGERGGVLGMALPSSLSPTFPSALSSVVLHRKHLPSGILRARSVLPLLVSTREPTIAMVLPFKYWPAELVHWWYSNSP